MGEVAKFQWVLVPAEPTPEMLAAAWDAWKSRHGGKLGPGPAFAEAVSAAIAASPPPPVEVSDQMQALAGFIQRLEGLVAKNEAIFNAALAEYRARYRDEHSTLSAIGAKDADWHSGTA